MSLQASCASIRLYIRILNIFRRLCDKISCLFFVRLCFLLLWQEEGWQTLWIVSLTKEECSEIKYRIKRYCYSGLSNIYVSKPLYNHIYIYIYIYTLLEPPQGYHGGGWQTLCHSGDQAIPPIHHLAISWGQWVLWGLRGVRGTVEKQAPVMVSPWT